MGTLCLRLNDPTGCSDHAETAKQSSNIRRTTKTTEYPERSREREGVNGKEREKLGRSSLFTSGPTQHLASHYEQ